MKLVTQNYQKKLLFPRNNCSYKISFSEEVAVRKSTCLEKVHALNNYLFWRKSSSETVAVLTKYLSS